MDSIVMIFRARIYCIRNFSYSVIKLKGHSKWQNIKSTKLKVDAQKSLQTTRLLQKLKKAVQIDGFDLKLNKGLAAIQQEFRASNLSLDSFNRALDRLKKQKVEMQNYELIGPSGSLFIIETETENRVKMQQIIAKYINKVGGGFRFQGTQNQFSKKGILRVYPEIDGIIVPLETMEEIGIDLDCEDVALVKDGDEQYYELSCSASRVHDVQKKLEDRKLTVISSEQEMRANHTVILNEDDCSKVEKFYAFLQENDDVIQIFDNIDPQKVAAAKSN